MGKMNREFQKQIHVNAAVDERELGYFDNLPADIVGLILSLLPGKEAATKATLSKTCQQQCPVLNFDDFTYNHSVESNLSKKEKSNVFNRMVDDSLSKFCPLVDTGRKSIRFCIENELILKHMNRWLKYATINQFTDMFLEFGPENYCLPRSMFASKSLTVLHLSRCTLPRKILNGCTSLDSLQELHLTHVSSARRLIDHLRYICPALVKLTLRSTTTIHMLRLSCLDKLTEVDVEDFGHIDSIVIKAQNLRIFKYYCGRTYYKKLKACNINVSKCGNLEVLYLDSSPEITGFFPDICSKFPFLQELFLSFCGLSIPFKIESPVLQILVLTNTEFVVNSAINTPNLQYLKCINPSFFPTMTSTPQEIKIELRQIDLYKNQILNASWFLKLRTFIKNLPSKCMKLSIELVYSMVKFKCDELIVDACNSSKSPLINVLNLEIDTIITENYIELIDGLLWSCHPKTLSIRSSNHHIKQKFIKDFCYEFCNRETKQNCCRPNHVRCWRHYLRHVDMEQLGTNCNNTLEHHQKFFFNLKWERVKRKKSTRRRGLAR